MLVSAFTAEEETGSLSETRSWMNVYSDTLLDLFDGVALPCLEMLWEIRISEARGGDLEIPQKVVFVCVL